VTTVNPYAVRNQDGVMVLATPLVYSDFGLATILGRARNSQTLVSFKKYMHFFFG